MAYPLVMTNIAMENHHCLMGKLTISMVTFHSYVQVPENNIYVCLFVCLYGHMSDLVQNTI